MSGATTPASPGGRASLLTPAGRGAVAVITAEGAAAFAVADVRFCAANGVPLSRQEINRIAFGHWADADSSAGIQHREEVVACRTAPDQLEIHCHGGIAAAERILTALSHGHCAVVTWRDWLGQRAPASLEAEAESALAAALTRRTAAILLDQRQGALRRELEALCAALHENMPDSIGAAKQRIAALLEHALLGLRLTRPWQVAIAGRPNVGKSSLINALVGYERAIVFDQPGTTRDVLAAETAIEGWPVRLSDAAGLRATNDPLEAAGVDLAQQQLGRADLVIWVLDATTLAPGDFAAPSKAARREMAAELTEQPVGQLLTVVNKCDLVHRAAFPSPDCIITSAVTGAGLSELLALVAQRLVPRRPAPGLAVPFTARHVQQLCEAQDSIALGDAAQAAAALAMLLE